MMAPGYLPIIASCYPDLMERCNGKGTAALHSATPGFPGLIASWCGTITRLFAMHFSPTVTSTKHTTQTIPGGAETAPVTLKEGTYTEFEAACGPQSK